MRTKILFSTIILLALCAIAALAANVTGKWVAEVEGRNGTQQITFDLKQSGMDLTGTVTGGFGGRGGGGGGMPPAQEISEGKVEGDNVSFAVVRQTQNGERKTTYKGMVSGTELKLSEERPGRDGNTRTREIVAKKQ